MPAEIEPREAAAAVVGCKYPDNWGSKFKWNISTHLSASLYVMIS